MLSFLLNAFTKKEPKSILEMLLPRKVYKKKLTCQNQTCPAHGGDDALDKSLATLKTCLQLALKALCNLESIGGRDLWFGPSSRCCFKGGLGEGRRPKGQSYANDEEEFELLADGLSYANTRAIKCGYSCFICVRIDLTSERCLFVRPLNST